MYYQKERFPDLGTSLLILVNWNEIYFLSFFFPLSLLKKKKKNSRKGKKNSDSEVFVEEDNWGKEDEVCVSKSTLFYKK